MSKMRLSIFFLLLLSIVIVSNALSIFPLYWWFQSVGFSLIWWEKIKWQGMVFSFGFLLSFLWLWGHLQLSLYVSKNKEKDSSSSSFLNQIWFKIQQSAFLKIPQTFFSFLVKSLVVGTCVVFGILTQKYWYLIFLYGNHEPTGIKDAFFFKDLSFYFFTKPLLESVLGWGILLLVVTLVMVTWIYLFRRVFLWVLEPNPSGVRLHLFSLLALLMWMFAGKSALALYDMVYNVHKLIVGIGYTDAAIRVPVQKLLIAFWVFLGFLFLFMTKYPKKIKWVLGGIGGLGLVYFIAGGILPALIQRYVVAPNELQKETPYMTYHIQATREAFGLSNVKESAFNVQNTLTANALKSQETLIQNIALWNAEQLNQVFSQLQEIRPYYDFGGIDVDRYQINGKMQQVMISAREMNVDQLSAQAQTWINRHLVFTHGYGLCMSPVNAVTSEGLPEFFVHDLPPKTRQGFTVARPEIYFGEKTSDYIVVNTKQQEFDYPKGDSNVYTRYQGAGGVQLNAFFKRLVFAASFSDLKLLLSSLITNETRILYRRSILEAVQTVLPFLVYDTDPYLILTPNGRLTWIIDGYSVSDQYPYATKGDFRFNYIRHVVKVTIDAYTGEMVFYQLDDKDPFIRALNKGFPGLLKPKSEMPNTVQDHLKYPKALFEVQASILATYHMQDPQVFYNKEDVWNIPLIKGETEEKRFQSQYLVTRLPGDLNDTFVLTIPFTPDKKSNMIALLSVNNNKEAYGQMVVYKFQKDKTIYGPSQLESRINQDPEISKDLTLWGQMGSRVYRGQLVILPIEHSLIYIQPVYLQATNGKLPELKRVIFSYADQVVMRDNLNTSIQDLFSESRHVSVEQQEDPKGTLKRLYSTLKTSAQSLDFEAMGKAIQALGKAIQNL